jgi:hypothetical protein
VSGVSKEAASRQQSSSVRMLPCHTRQSHLEHSGFMQVSQKKIWFSTDFTLEF